MCNSLTCCDANVLEVLFLVTNSGQGGEGKGGLQGLCSASSNTSAAMAGARTQHARLIYTWVNC